jgi:hypothetical protein
MAGAFSGVVVNDAADLRRIAKGSHFAATVEASPQLVAKTVDIEIDKSTVRAGSPT